MEFVDTHCHIHFADYELDPDQAILDAAEAGVTRLMCVGCTLEDSRLGVTMAEQNNGIWASIGLHPHEAKEYINNPKALQEFRSLASHPKVVAIGEIGLDYYYKHSDPAEQAEMLRFQLTIAQENKLPVIFHVRDAFDDFWPIYDEFRLPGVIHSFSAGQKEIDQILSRDLSIGLNGIMTFTKDQKQLDAVKTIPLDKIVLETDAPFLTPTPYRGTICQPKHVVTTAEFLSKLYNCPLSMFAAATTKNAMALFNLV
jgi:TatD DNase family protein